MKFFVHYSADHVCPSRANPLATGMDIRALEEVVIPEGKTVVIPTGLELRHCPTHAIGLPVDIQVRGRSGLTSMGFLVHLGTIDADYEGEIGVIATNMTGGDFEVPKGGRIAQLVFPAGTRVQVTNQPAPASVQSVTGTGAGHAKPRGRDGFGSTGLD